MTRWFWYRLSEFSRRRYLKATADLNTRTSKRRTP